MKLEFGCGDKAPKQGFWGVDIRDAPHVSIVCAAWEITEYLEPGVVEEIYSRHFFEHLTYAQADLTLQSWMQVMAPGAKMEMMVPDIMFHIQQWLDPDRKTKVNHHGMTWEEWAKRGFWGHQRGEFEDTWDVHKMGYDFELLSDLLMKHGMERVQRIENLPHHLHVCAFKPVS